ncbi:hypothetical protein JB92DRAFT_350858 [Gautieria morchelliformis]|nr:hypothetical protein JB92DRAFT_350858 [Gautieria morchelliformis]
MTRPPTPRPQPTPVMPTLQDLLAYRTYSPPTVNNLNPSLPPPPPPLLTPAPPHHRLRRAQTGLRDGAPRWPPTSSTPRYRHPNPHPANGAQWAAHTSPSWYHAHHNRRALTRSRIRNNTSLKYTKPKSPTASSARPSTHTNSAALEGRHVTASMIRRTQPVLLAVSSHMKSNTMCLTLRREVPFLAVYLITVSSQSRRQSLSIRRKHTNAGTLRPRCPRCHGAMNGLCHGNPGHTLRVKRDAMSS